jgi:hypothetical protein
MANFDVIIPRSLKSRAKVREMVEAIMGTRKPGTQTGAPVDA